MLAGGFDNAYSLLMAHEVAAVRAGNPVSTYIAPRDLDPLTRRHLRESFRAIGLIQGRVDRDWIVRAERTVPGR
jgi:CBS domain-containing protein